jgi:glutamine amidotransferase
MIAVIDYGMGNAGSILNMLSKIGAEAVLTRNPDEILASDKLILPGIGAFDEGMRRLEELDLIAPLNEKVIERGAPILGVCLGMQLFASSSEEGTRPGLGWFDARTVRFHFTEKQLLVPHMGWNYLSVRKESDILCDLGEDSRFYFVHSYYLQCERSADVLAVTEYGHEFVSAVARDRIIGVQFHPEKSLRWGMQLFRRFVSRA